jgi:hypothetical protein
MDTQRKRSSAGRSGVARCREVQQYLTSRLHFIGGFAAVVGVLALFYGVELVLPRHWAVGALLRLVFLGGLGFAGYTLATRVVPAALRQAASVREEEEEAAPLSALDAAALEAQERAKLEAANRAAAELEREEEEEALARQAAAAAAAQQRKDAAAAKAAQRKSKK